MRARVCALVVHFFKDYRHYYTYLYVIKKKKEEFQLINSKKSGIYSGIRCSFKDQTPGALFAMLHLLTLRLLSISILLSMERASSLQRRRGRRQSSRRRRRRDRLTKKGISI